MAKSGIPTPAFASAALVPRGLIRGKPAEAG
jgi:hypothetical protein